MNNNSMLDDLNNSDEESQHFLNNLLQNNPIIAFDKGQHAAGGADPFANIRSNKNFDEISRQVWENSPFGENSIFHPNFDASDSNLLQINITKKPKDFGDTLSFDVNTNLPVGEKIDIYLYDSDSYFSDEPNIQKDTELYKLNYTLSKTKNISIELTNAMEKLAFKDLENDSAECYVKITNQKIKAAFSQVFIVKSGINESSLDRLSKLPVYTPSWMKGERQKQSCQPLELTPEQKARFTSTVLAETNLGSEFLKDIAWIYFNRVSMYGLEDKSGLNASTAYREKNRNYKLGMYYLGFGDEYANFIYDNLPLSKYIKENEWFKIKVEPNFTKMEDFIEKEIFSSSPATYYKGWIGQGYYKDLDLNPDDSGNSSKDPKWYMARQYYWSQLQNKVSVKYVEILKDGTATSFIFDEINIKIFFIKNPNLLPEPNKVKKFENNGVLNFDL